MIKDIDKLTGFLERKLTLVREFRRLSLQYMPGGEKADAMKEAEDYAYLIDKRERFVNEMKDIDKECQSSFMRNGSYLPEYAETADRIISLIKLDIQDIVDHEIKINEKLPWVRENIQKSIKELNEGKSLNQLYQNNMYDAGSLSQFDKKS